MPDRADVEQALAAFVANALYPTGAGTNSAVGTPCRVYRGWPVSAALNDDLARGVTHVTVQPVAGAMRDRNRFSQDWQGSVPTASLNASVDGETVTFDGTPAPGQVAGVLVDGQGYA